MRSWSISKRFLFSIIVFSVPLILIVFYLYKVENLNIQFSQKEYDGAVIVQRLNGLQSDLLTSFIEKISQNNSQDIEVSAEISNKWKSIVIDAYEGASSGEIIDLQNAITAEELSFSKNGSSINALAKMLSQQQVVRGHVVDKFNIILDPDLDSYYVMDSLNNILPTLQNLYLDLLKQSVSLDENSSEDKVKVEILKSHISKYISNARGALEKVKQFDADLYDVYPGFQTEFDAYLAKLDNQQKIVDKMTMTEVKTSSLSLFSEGMKMMTRLDQDFVGMLNVRLDFLKESRNKNLFYSILSVVVSILISAYFGFSIKKTIAAFHDAVRDLRERANTALDIGQNLIDASTKVSDASSTQAAAIEETSASLEEITSMVSINAQSSLKAKELASEARETAIKGSIEMEKLMASMNDISASSKKIEEIMGLIDDIAFQTNLLSLNASVEAARAGEHGKGFAVVADAVRTLAQKSAQSAKEIKSLISESLVQIDDGKKGADQAGHSMALIQKSIENVSVLNGEIANASQEQTAGIHQISRAVSELEQATIGNSGVARQSSDYSEKSLAQAEELMRIVDILEAELDGAKRTVVNADFNFQEAIQAHLKWKARLKNYVDGVSKENLNHEVVCLDNQCPLGKWIYGAGARYQNLAVYDRLRIEHAEFHIAAAEIVENVQNGSVKDAISLLKDGGVFDRKTKATVSCLQDLQRQMST